MAKLVVASKAALLLFYSNVKIKSVFKERISASNQKFSYISLKVESALLLLHNTAVPSKFSLKFIYFDIAGEQ